MARKAKGDKYTLRTKKEMTDDLLLMISLRKRGTTWRAIAVEINNQRSYDLHFLTYYNQYCDELPKTYDKKQIELERRRMVREIYSEIDELWDSWLLSKETRKSRIVEKRYAVGNKDLEDENDDGVEKTETTVTTEIGIGDPSFLLAITKKRERLARLTGADVPVENVNKNYDMSNANDIKALEKKLDIERRGNK